MNINPNMANRDVCNVVFEDYRTHKIAFQFNRANATTTEMTGEIAYAYGGSGHPARVSFSGEKKGTVKIETQIQPFMLFSIATGAKVEKVAKFIKKETVETTEAEPTITLTKTPVEGTPVTVFPAGTTENEVEATLSGTTVTLTDATPGDYDVWYIEELTEGVQKLNIKSSTFPKAFKIYMNTYYVTEDEEVVGYKITAYKAKPQPNFTINNSNTGDPATFTLTLDLMSDKNDDMLDMLLVEDEE